MCVPTVVIWIPLPKSGDCGDFSKWQRFCRGDAPLSPETRDGVMSWEAGKHNTDKARRRSGLRSACATPVPPHLLLHQYNPHLRHQK